VHLARGGLIVALGMCFAAALQAAFHLGVARLLGPADYSLLATLLTIVLIVTPAVLVLQAAVAREVAWRDDREGKAAVGIVLRDTLSALTRRLSAGVAIGMLFVVVGAAFIDSAYLLAGTATILTIAGMLMFALSLGGLQGTHRLSEVSAAQCLFGGLKLGAGIALALLGFAAGGVMLGVALAAWAAAAISAMPLRSVWAEGRSLRSRPRRILRGFTGGPAFALTLFAALSSAGILAARLSFEPHTAGAYAALSFGAYSLLVAGLTVTTVLFPRPAGQRDPRQERRRLLRGLMVVAALGAAGTVALFAFPETIVRLAFGPSYVFAAAWLGPLGIAMTLLALVNVYVHHFLSLGHSQFALPFTCLLAVQLALYAFFHSAPNDLTGVLVLTAVLLLGASEAFERRLRRHSRPFREVPEQELFVPLLTPDSARRLADSEDEVTVVIPAYDEASRIDPTLRGTVACMEGFGCPYEILVVDDGSRDATRRVSEEVARELDEIRVIGYRQNAGKGYAIVQGAKAARGKLVLFLDADLEVHPRQLQVLYETMQEAQADVVTGSKMHADSRVDYPRKRQVMSWGYYAIVRFFFGLPVRDTQTGLKLFRKEVLDGVVPRMLVKRFAFDLEALVIAHRLGFRVVEAPVVVTRERDLPKIGWRDAIHTAWDTAAVWYRAYLRRYYDRSVGSNGRPDSPMGETQLTTEASPGTPKTD
jgi:O-antigen/teichoic acid export membrane protein